MIKEDWLYIRTQEEVPIFLFYDYFLDNKDKNRTSITLKEFEQVFPTFMASPVIITRAGVRYVSFENILHKVYNYFDAKFA